MHFAIVIPTFKRISKLERCLNSILKQSHQDFNIYVMCDNQDWDTFKHIEEKYKDNDKILPIIILDHQYVMGCWNLFTRDNFDLIKQGMCWIVDDTELLPDCLEKLSETFISHFPDMDGMVGISQIYPLLDIEKQNWKENGQCAIGRKFIERFPNRQVCAIEYQFFYQDEEVLEYAKSIHKFVLCKDAKLIHHSANFYSSEMDETHKIPRDKIKLQDTMTYKKRKERGLVWGKSFETIKEYDERMRK